MWWDCWTSSMPDAIGCCVTPCLTRGTFPACRPSRCLLARDGAIIISPPPAVFGLGRLNGGGWVGGMVVVG